MNQKQRFLRPARLVKYQWWTALLFVCFVTVKHVSTDRGNLKENFKGGGGYVLEISVYYHIYNHGKTLAAIDEKLEKNIALFKVV